MASFDPVSRRTAVRTAAVACAAGLAGCGAPGSDPTEEGTPPVDDEEHDPEGDPDEEHDLDEEEWSGVTEITLEAYDEGWEGVEPEVIEGDLNPTFLLEDGVEYEVSFEIGDDEPHNLAFEAGGEEVLTATETVEGEGEGASLQVEASEDLERYVCEVHRDSMEGTIQLMDGE